MHNRFDPKLPLAAPLIHQLRVLAPLAVPVIPIGVIGQPADTPLQAVGTTLRSTLARPSVPNRVRWDAQRKPTTP